MFFFISTPNFFIWPQIRIKKTLKSNPNPRKIHMFTINLGQIGLISIPNTDPSFNQESRSLILMYTSLPEN